MPVIDRGDDYFQAGTYTGNGSTQTITGLRFQPDLVWIKGRSGATDHALYDAVRGVQKQLESNQTGAESTETTGLTAFTSDGFTVGSLAQVNTNAATYAYWAWKANGAGVTNTAGTITSTVSVNTTSGFSIVTYTGTGSAATVGHGLGVAPGMIIVKARSSAVSWQMFHQSLGKDRTLQLNETDTGNTVTNYWGTSAPNSTVFGVIGGGYDNNLSGVTTVAYCFAPVAGYSAFGSYTGNGSTDGPMVYTGFRPAFLLLKHINDSGASWYVFDSARNEYNVMNLQLKPNLINAELNASTNNIDFLSNGFKCRTSNGDTNPSGTTVIYACFAENPFAYSLAR